MDRFQSIASRYEITEYFARKLKQLEGYEIVLILDDSGSMNTPVRSGDQSKSSPFTRSQTRWDELKQSVGIIVDLAAVMDPDGLDLYFLNRATLHGVTSSEQLHAVFAQPPSGLTPITDVLKHVLHAKRTQIQERKLLILIFTDGAPTNKAGYVDTNALKNVLLYERDPKRVFVSIIACTDEDSTMDYLNGWDRTMNNLDVCDDYWTEKAEVQKAQGKNFPFTYGNYVCKVREGTEGHGGRHSSHSSRAATNKQPSKHRPRLSSAPLV